METEMKKGGKRNNSGRKPLPKESKKIPVTIYIEESIVDTLGGKDGLRKKVISMLSAKPNQSPSATSAENKSLRDKLNSL
jgi:hypothetical protein